MSDAPRNEYQQKIRTLAFAKGERPAKVTTDVHDNHTVDVVEHWDGERQDIVVKPDPVHVEIQVQQED